MSVTPTAPAQPPEQKKLMEKQFRWEESFFAYGYAYATLPAGWEFEECLRPEFWVNVMQYFRADPATGNADRAGTRIEVRTEDHAYIGFLYVRAVSPGGLIVECIGPDMDAKTGKACKPHYFGKAASETPGYDVRWNVGKRKYQIVRISDKEIIGEALTRELAEEWISRTMGAAKAA